MMRGSFFAGVCFRGVQTIQFIFIGENTIPLLIIPHYFLVVCNGVSEIDIYVRENDKN